jgi:hypothetical protein
MAEPENDDLLGKLKLYGVTETVPGAAPEAPPPPPPPPYGASAQFAQEPGGPPGPGARWWGGTEDPARAYLAPGGLPSMREAGQMAVDYPAGAWGTRAALRVGQMWPAAAPLTVPATAFAVPFATSLGYQAMTRPLSEVSPKEAFWSGAGGVTGVAPWIGAGGKEMKYLGSKKRYQTEEAAREQKIYEQDVAYQKKKEARDISQKAQERAFKEATEREEFTQKQLRRAEEVQAKRTQDWETQQASKTIEEDYRLITQQPPASKGTYALADAQAAKEPARRSLPATESLGTQWMKRGRDPNHPVMQVHKEIMDALESPDRVPIGYIGDKMKQLNRMARTHPDADALWQTLADDMGDSPAGRLYRQGAGEFKAEMARQDLWRKVIQPSIGKGDLIDPTKLNQKLRQFEPKLVDRLPPDELARAQDLARQATGRLTPIKVERGPAPPGERIAPPPEIPKVTRPAPPAPTEPVDRPGKWTRALPLGAVLNPAYLAIYAALRGIADIPRYGRGMESILRKRGPTAVGPMLPPTEDVRPSRLVYPHAGGIGSMAGGYLGGGPPAPP